MREPGYLHPKPAALAALGVLWQRIAVTLADLLFVAYLFLMSSYCCSRVMTGTGTYLLVPWWVLLLVAIEVVAIWQALGTSLAMRATGLSVVDASGRRARPASRLARYFAWHASFLPLVGAAAALWDGDHLAWHDRWTGTRWIQTEETPSRRIHWIRTSWGWSIFIALAVTLTAGVFITKVDLRSLLTGASKTGIVWKRLVQPDWSLLSDGLRLLTVTLFMALMATLLAIIFAVPLSFLAARNLTRGLTMRLGVPISFVWGSVAGIAGSLLVTTAVVRVQTQHGAVSLLIPLIFFVTLVLVVVLRLMRLHSACSSVTRLEVKGYVLAGSLCATSLCGTLAAKLDAHALMGLGVAVGAIGFIIFVGEALQVLTRSLPKRIKTGVLAVAGALPGAVGAILVTTLAALVLTLFGVGGLQERGLYVVFKLPVGALGYAIAGVIGAALGASYAARRTLDHSVQIGLLVYTIVRGVMSVIRSIEPIVWAIIFVVWVRVGAFPGVLALFVCSIADLTKLYSEQLESIDPGPAEAITATGGNRAQVVLYGIVPQIINPYLSFTLYRWDINVRMATIIGIVGGGGIGNPLYLATRQWEWEAAGLYMLLIVVAVWAIDYFSSRLRERLS